jgi:Flp pilus assembly protein TadG
MIAAAPKGLASVDHPRIRVGGRRRFGAQRGQALVEFALVALVLYMLLAVTVEFGRLIFSAQALQDASRMGAREIALTPLPAQTQSLDVALTLSPVPSRVYDDRYLVLSQDQFTNQTTDGTVGGPLLPHLNLMLLPLFVYESVGGVATFHYPGTLVTKTINGFSYTTVLIALVNTIAAPSPGNGMTPFEYDPASVQWIQVVEEVRSNPADPTTSQFPASNGGYVILRVNYPFQSAMLSAYENPQPPVFPPQPNIASPVLENDAAFDGLTPNVPGSGATFTYFKVDDPNETGAYAGAAGLGRQFALAQTVRPFRKVLASQAVFRREVFQ